MKCPTCGYEVTPDEAFCGQCGTPRVAPPPGYQPANRMNMPPSPRSGLLSTGAYTANTAFVPPPDTYQPGTFNPGQQLSQMPSQTSYAPNSVSLPPASAYQQTGFYHDATEAMSPIQHATSGLLPGNQQPDFSGMASFDRGQFPSQVVPSPYPFQTGNYAGPMPNQHPFATGQGYMHGPQGNFPPPPQKQSNQIILIVCITLVVILLGAVGITTFALLKPNTTNQPATIVTAAPTSVPTMAPTAVPTTAPTAIPTPSPIPTPAADAGFAWCGINCNQYGFTTEFPLAWQGTPIQNSQGVQFINQSMPNVYAAFKTPGATGDSPNDILMNDVQSTFGSQPGYATPPTPVNATIGGAPWYATATNYNDTQNQPIHVEVYATVYQGKAYIIELQAPQSNNQFDSVKQQFFVNMLVKFQFVPTGQ